MEMLSRLMGVACEVAPDAAAATAAAAEAGAGSSLGDEAPAHGTATSPDTTEYSPPRLAAYIPELEEPEDLVQPEDPDPEEEPEQDHEDPDELEELNEPDRLDELVPPAAEAKPHKPKINPVKVRELLQYVGTDKLTLHDAVDNNAAEMARQICDMSPDQIKRHNGKMLVPFFAAGMNGKTELLPVIHEAAIRHFGPKEGPMYTTHWKWAPQGQVTLLHHAALNDFEDVVEWLCANGAEIDQFSYSPNPQTPPFTPIMMACKHNCTRAACALVHAGADVNVRVPDGNGSGDLTPLHICIQLMHTDLAAFLFSKGARNTCTFGCTKCRMHSKWMARRLVTMRENIEARLAADEREAARRKEFEEVMEELNFLDFVAEMKKINGVVESHTSQQPDSTKGQEQVQEDAPSGPRAAASTDAKKQQVRKKTGKKNKKKKGGRK